jgi:major membrane immunogen (membrane-anchored lipoprotein)
MLVKKLLIMLSLVVALKLECACDQDPAQEQETRRSATYKVLEQSEDGLSSGRKIPKFECDCDCRTCNEDYKSKGGILKNLDSDTLKLILLTLFVESEKFVMALFSIAYGATESIFSIANLFVKYGLCSSRS